MFGIHKISETILLGVLDLRAFNSYEKIGSKRELEKKGTECLLGKLMDNRPFTLMYTETKKPFLKDKNVHISISHSHDKLAIIINNEQSTGVDIELIRDKVKNIQNKFLNGKELVFAANDEETLTVLWAAKESIYKAYGLKEVDFKENIFIEPYDVSENNFYGKIDLPTFKKTYLLSRKKIDNYMLVYILSEVR